MTMPTNELPLHHAVDWGAAGCPLLCGRADEDCGPEDTWQIYPGEVTCPECLAVMAQDEEDEVEAVEYSLAVEPILYRGIEDCPECGGWCGYLGGAECWQCEGVGQVVVQGNEYEIERLSIFEANEKPRDADPSL